MKKYDPSQIEAKWQGLWEETGIYHARDFDPRPKYYYLVEFPYPSGDGLHVGHLRSFTALDIMARHKRMMGFNVLYPMGFDEFGLPTENFAIKHKIAPQVATEQNVTNFRRQMQAMGLSFDWSREVRTSDPKYYRWTQWLFLQLFKAGLAYQAELPINWCPKEKTGLANEEVVDGRHERCGTLVEKKLINQWVLAITKYADRLIEDLGGVDYLDKISAQQINWVGRSEGAEIIFKLRGITDQPDDRHQVTVYTTRPDTLFGATFLVVSPEVADSWLKVGWKAPKAAKDYIVNALRESELQRQEETKEKTGVDTGIQAVHPVTGELLPVWVADYVLGSYGTGAIMAVPAHDQRDGEFAEKFGLKIINVIQGGEEPPYEGPLENSGEFNGLLGVEAKRQIVKWLFEHDAGRGATKYKLRDWIFSRQHYWGEPIPIVHCEIDGVVPVPEEQLPVTLPEVESYEPTDTGESPLATMTDWVNVTCPKCGGPAKRETDTMPNWAGSSWYYLRYADPHNDQAFADARKLEYWTPVDLYNGGMEHTTLHLLYSRFWHKFLYDQGLVPTSEPYARRRSHGMILASDNQKMSKSRGNVVNPDAVVKKYGADTLRVYEMFMGPFDEATSWSDERLGGANRFLYRVWDLGQKLMSNRSQNGVADGSLAAVVDRALHKTLKKVGEDIEGMHFNTMVSAMMELLNTLTEAGVLTRLQEPSNSEIALRAARLLILMTAPLAPHLAEELWHELGEGESVHIQAWPKYDPELLKEDVMTIVVQVNGKVRGELAMPVDASEDAVVAAAKVDGNVARHLENQKIIKTISIPHKLVNFVVKQ
jgi:leucyl-tRNA synthetase